MTSFRSHVMIDRSPDDVWRVVRDPARVADWLPGVEACTVEGDVRRCRFGGRDVVEQILEIDDVLRRFRYRVGIVAGAAALPNTIDVLDVEGRSVVVYSSEGASGAPAEIVATALEAGVQGLRRYLEEPTDVA